MGERKGERETERQRSDPSEIDIEAKQEIGDREKQAKRPKRRGIGGSLVVWLDFRRQSFNPT